MKRLLAFIAALATAAGVALAQLPAVSFQVGPATDTNGLFLGSWTNAFSTNLAALRYALQSGGLSGTFAITNGNLVFDGSPVAPNTNRTASEYHQNLSSFQIVQTTNIGLNASLGGATITGGPQGVALNAVSGPLTVVTTNVASLSSPKNAVLAITDALNGYADFIPLEQLIASTLTASQVVGLDTSKRIITLGPSSYLTGLTNNVQSQINANASAITTASNAVQTEINLPIPISSYFTAIGDSITAMSAATNGLNAWPVKVANTKGLGTNILAYGGGDVIDAYAQLFGPTGSQWVMTNSNNSVNYLGQQPASVTNGSIIGYLAGFNDMRDNGTSSSLLTFFGNTLQGLIANACTPYKFAASTATTSGSWNTWTNYYGGGLSATANTATLTFTNVVGDAIYVAYINTMSASNDFGAISVAVDGVNYGSFAANTCPGNRFVNGGNTYQQLYMTPNHDGKLWYVPALARVKLGTKTRHQVVVTSSGAGGSNPSVVLWCAGNGQTNNAPVHGPLFIVGNTLRQVTYTGSGSDAAAGLYNEMIGRVVGQLQSDGLRVRLARASEWYDPISMVSGDGVHPTDTGHLAIANAFLDALSSPLPPRPEQSLAAQIHPGATVGPNAAQSGTLNFADGASIQFRDASNAIEGPSISSTTEALTLASKNSAGSSSSTQKLNRVGFPFYEVTHAGTGGAGVFNQFDTSGLIASSGTQTFLSLQAGVAQTGTANYALLDLQVGNSATFGSGVNNVLQFNTVSPASAAAQWYWTDQGRIVISPVASSSGVTHVFNTSANTNSSVQITFGSNTLDRRLSLGGNSIATAVNSTGAAANLSVNQVNGADTIIGGGQTGNGLRVSASGVAVSILRHGTAALVAGSKVVSDTTVTANTRIFVTSNTDGGTPGWLRVSARSAGTSFTVTSSSGSDTSTFAYLMVEP
jgi:hypothetical protein